MMNKRLNRIIDDKLHTVFHGTESNEADYWLVNNLKDTSHTFLFSKRNTSLDQIFSISGFLLDKTAELLSPPSKPARKIEFLGDSFTAAEGNEAVEQDMVWEEKMVVTNIDQGFAPRIAHHFDAQYHTICRPGIGMATDWEGNHNMNLLDRFDRTLMDAVIPKWNFQEWIPGLVVIGLGLNDYSGFGGWEKDVSESDSDLYRSKYHEFINMLRNIYPNVKIVAVAAHVDWIRKNVQQVVTEENAKGYQDIYYGQFDEFPGGYVANGHPTVETHQKIANQIIKVIEDIHLFAE